MFEINVFGSVQYFSSLERRSFLQESDFYVRRGHFHGEWNALHRANGEGCDEYLKEKKKQTKKTEDALTNAGPMWVFPGGCWVKAASGCPAWPRLLNRWWVIPESANERECPLAPRAQPGPEDRWHSRSTYQWRGSDESSNMAERHPRDMPSVCVCMCMTGSG